MKEVLTSIAKALEDSNILMAESVNVQKQFLKIRIEESIRNDRHGYSCLERNSYHRFRDLTNMFAARGDSGKSLVPLLYEAFSAWKEVSEEAGYMEQPSWEVFTETYKMLVDTCKKELESMGPTALKQTIDDLENKIDMIENFKKEREDV
jgi:hypothetical protein